MIGSVTRYITPIWGRPPPCKQALEGMSQYRHVSSSLTNKTPPLFCFPPILRPVDHQCVRFQASKTRTLGSKTTARVNKNSWSRNYINYQPTLIPSSISFSIPNTRSSRKFLVTRHLSTKILKEFNDLLRVFLLLRFSKTRKILKFKS